jgi:GntR family transcriptional regulator, negative regulator for fad regulon and positive regulator of fabA
MNEGNDKPLRPAQFTEEKILKAIMDKTYPPGAHLPSERLMAGQLGVTRPTVRETLQRLAREGWVEIRHGKPTRVNDYWKKGGLGMLGTMAKHAGFLPDDFISNLLEFRLNLLPSCAQSASDNEPVIFIEHLSRAKTLGDDPGEFALYDWKLQELMATHCKNILYPMVLNDFSEVYKRLAFLYFSLEVARKSSLRYYGRFLSAVKGGGKGVKEVVRDVFKESITIWKKVQK